MIRHLLPPAPLAALVLALLALAGPAVAQAPYMEEMTWPEVAARMAQGARVVLVPTGGTEQSGPHLALSKHSAIIRAAAGAIATELGNALVAPVITVVPEGNLSPPSDNLRWPGTVGVSEDTFARLLGDTAASLALHGFRVICFIGDHGGSQAVQARVAQALDVAWRPLGLRAVQISAYYDPGDEVEWLAARGIAAGAQGWHGGVAETAMLMAVAPDLVRPDLLAPATWTAWSQPGAEGDPSLASAELGRELLNRKVAAAVRQIREALRP